MHSTACTSDEHNHTQQHSPQRGVPTRQSRWSWQRISVFPVAHRADPAQWPPAAACNRFLDKHAIPTSWTLSRHFVTKTNPLWPTFSLDKSLVPTRTHRQWLIHKHGHKQTTQPSTQLAISCMLETCARKHSTY
jgi:hypothetical protein